MENKDKMIEDLNDLVRINNDRIKGYEKALEELGGHFHKDHPVFLDRIAESKRFKGELSVEIVKLGGKPDEGTTSPGAIYRAWMDMKNNFKGSDNSKSILESCEFGEDAALTTYDRVMQADEMWPQSIVNVLTDQRLILEEAHTLIKAERDAAGA